MIFFVPQKILNYFDNLIQRHATGVHTSITKDTVKAFQEATKNINFHFTIYSAIYIILAKIIQKITLTVYPPSFYLSLFNAVLILSLFIPITVILIILTNTLKPFVSIALAPILFIPYYYISKCPRGSIAGIGALLQIAVLIIERP